MDITTYLQESAKTEAHKTYIENISKQLLHGAIGVCTEAAELLDADTPITVKEELGDVMWNIAVIMRAEKMKPVKLQNNAVYANINSDWLKRYAGWPVGAICIISGEMLGYVNTVLFEGVPMDQIRLKLYTSLTLIYASVIAVSIENDWDLGDVLDENIIKLGGSISSGGKQDG